MQKYTKLLIIIAFSSLFYANIAIAGYNSQCLSDCFSTGHDCKYCSYQCYSEDTLKLTPNYSGDSTCPLQSYLDRQN